MKTLRIYMYICNVKLIYKYLPYLSQKELYQGLKEIDPDLWIQKYIPLSNFIYFNTDFQNSSFKGKR